MWIIFWTISWLMGAPGDADFNPAFFPGGFATKAECENASTQLELELTPIDMLKCQWVDVKEGQLLLPEEFMEPWRRRVEEKKREEELGPQRDPFFGAPLRPRKSVGGDVRA